MKDATLSPYIVAQRQVARSIMLMALVGLLPSTIFGGSATWKANPTSGDWNTSANWSPMTVPNGPSDTATFGLSNTTYITLSSDIELDSFVFTANASSYQFYGEGNANTAGPTLTLSGSGITNNSNTRPDFEMYDFDMTFRGTASAGNASIFEIGLLSFLDTSTAASASIDTSEAFIEFHDSSSAGSAGLRTEDDSTLFFYNTSNAGNAGIMNVGKTEFHDSSSADSASIETFYGGGGGGSLYFYDSSTGDLAQFDLEGLDPSQGDGGVLNIINHNAPGVRIGSLAGNKNSVVYLGANNLTVGSNSLNTTFDGAITGTGGSLTKTGGGKLTLTNADPTYAGNTDYTGGTTINKGVLIVNNTAGSATGSGPVQVVSGTLSGTGIIAGPVTVGNGTSSGASLRGGSGQTAGTLTINSKVTFNSQSTYTSYLNRTTAPKAGTLQAPGVTIKANVSFAWVETGRAALARGAQFIVIDNTSASPIVGRFSNLPANSTFTDNHGTTFKVSYNGGTGNDLVLTVQ